jgi:ribosome biogenesis GTPase / thiamine phosphate phosphatase
MSLEALGWNCHWREIFETHVSNGLLPARLVAEHRSYYTAATGTAELPASITGRLRNSAEQRSDLPGVGDFVGIRLSESGGPATIEVVLPRSSALIRKASGKPEPQLLAANVDVVFIVTAQGGDFSMPRIQRYLALVQQSGALPVIVVNKSDLGNDVAGLIGRSDGFPTNIPVHAVGARARDGLRVLERHFENNRTVALIGSSGVGKSTLTNRLLGREAQTTQAVRDHDGRGRHTTTFRQLLVRPHGGAIIDTPGLRGLEAWNADAAHEGDFDDIEKLAPDCRFSDCGHNTEPGCAVLTSIAQGDLTAERLAEYNARKQQGRNTR